MNTINHSRLHNTSGLLSAAKESHLCFECSPFGRWVRFQGNEAVVYVVQDPWGDGCCVLTIGNGRPQSEHFLNPQDAIMAVAKVNVPLSVGSSRP